MKTINKLLNKGLYWFKISLTKLLIYTWVIQTRKTELNGVKHFRLNPYNPIAYVYYFVSIVLTGIKVIVKNLFSYEARRDFVWTKSKKMYGM